MSAKPATSDPDCLFCRIIAGSIPCHRIYENEHVLAFLDIGPIAPGHALMIPKTHAVTIDQLDEQHAAAIGRVLPAISRAVCQAVGASNWNVLQNNGKLAHQAVGHVHVHIIPKFDDAGLGIDWPAGELDAEQAADLVQRITDQL